MVKVLSILLMLSLIRVGHTTESALEPQKEGAEAEDGPQPKKTAGGFIELEIEGDEEKPPGEPDREPASEADNADNGESSEGGGE